MANDQNVQVPEPMRVQLARLFGSNSIEGKTTTRNLRDWKRTLGLVLDELENYVEENVRTDKVHRYMLATGLWAARESLKGDNFLIGYIEGITRLALLLLGEYPDHRQRKPGRKKSGHYKLNYHRTQIWAQDDDQKLKTLLTAGRFGLPELTKNPEEVLREFREQFGYKANHHSFFEWYKKGYPQDYAAVF